MDSRQILHSLDQAENWQGILDWLSVPPKGAPHDLIRQIRAECHFRAYLEVWKKHPSLATMHCQKALALCPHHWTYLFHAGLCALRSGKYTEAKKLFLDCSLSTRPNGRSLLHAAVSLFCCDQITEATTVAQEADSLGPKTLRQKAVVLEALLLASKGDWAGAKTSLARLTNTSAPLAETVLNAFCEIHQGRFTEALQILARSKRKRDPDLCNAAGLAELGSNNPLEAARYFALVPHHNERIRSRFISAAKRYIQSHSDPIKALKNLNKRGQSPWVQDLLLSMKTHTHWFQGYLCIGKDDLTSATNHFLEALKSSSGHLSSGLAHSLALVGEIEEQPKTAVEGWRRAINQWKLETKGKSAFHSPLILGHAHLRLAHGYLQLQDPQNARREIQRARKLLKDPCKTADRQEALVLYVLEHRKQAWQLIKEYTHTDAHPLDHCLYGWLAMGAGYSSKAKELWTLALSDSQYHMEARHRILDHSTFEYLRRISEMDYRGASKVREIVGLLFGEDFRDEWIPDAPALDSNLNSLVHDSIFDSLPIFLEKPIHRALEELDSFVEYYLPKDDLRLAANAIRALRDVEPLSPLAVSILASLVENLITDRTDPGILLADMALQSIKTVHEARDVLRFMVIMTPFLPSWKCLETLLSRFPNLMEGHLLRFVRARNRAEARSELAIAEHLSKNAEDRTMIDLIRRLVEYSS